MIGPLVGAALPYAGVKLYFACIPEHTLIDTPSGATAIETVQPGDSVIGFDGKPVRVLQKHSYLEKTETVFLRVYFDDNASVDLCRMHRVNGVRARDLEVGQSIAGRHVTGIESRRGEKRSYDLLTEDSGYRISGVPVNSMIEEMNTAAATGMRSVRR
jgi:hypothetical protein